MDVDLLRTLFIVLGLLAGLIAMAVLIRLCHRRKRKPPPSCKLNKVQLNRKFVKGGQNEYSPFYHKTLPERKFYGLSFFVIRPGGFNPTSSWFLQRQGRNQLFPRNVILASSKVQSVCGQVGHTVGVYRGFSSNKRLGVFMDASPSKD